METGSQEIAQEDAPVRSRDGRGGGCDDVEVGLPQRIDAGDDRSEGRKSTGALLIPQSLAIARAIEELLLIWLASEAREWENRLVWLPV